MFRILVVDDDPAILKLVVRYVEAAGFEPVAAADGPTALARAREDSVDLAVVDIMLPGVSGLEICRRLREDFGIPVIMLTARGGIEDKSQAYRLGADDYLVKPFDPNELVLRIRAVLKRVREAGNGVRAPELHAEAQVLGREGTPRLRIDPERAEVRIEDRTIPMPRKEFQLLSLLAVNRNRAMTRERIVEALWGIDFEGDERVVDLYVDRLRRRLAVEDTPPSWRIRTLRGVGYMLEVDR